MAGKLQQIIETTTELEMIKTKKLQKNNFSFVCYKSVNSKSGRAIVVVYYSNLRFTLRQRKKFSQTGYISRKEGKPFSCKTIYLYC